MNLQERDWVLDGHKIGTIYFYTEIEPELQAYDPGVRVLPACFFYEKNNQCKLIKRYEPGEYRLMPNGGFEVWVDDGGRRYFDLDQVILHPANIKHKPTLDKISRKGNDEIEVKIIKPINSTGKKGRPSLDPAIKAEREAQRASQVIKSGGKRGRPKGTTTTTPKAPKVSDGKRGRRPLDPAIKEAREQEKLVRSIRSGGKRGRPKRQ
jgi:hypothetical protein